MSSVTRLNHRKSRPANWRVIGLCCCLIALSGCATLSEHQIGQQGGQLKPCPKAPRCVSSHPSEPASSAIAAYQLLDSAAQGWTAVVKAVAAMPRTSVVTKTTDYLHAEVTSPWGVYTDDLELLLLADKQRIAVRSTGRIGYYDFQVNRERVENLRQILSEQGLVSLP